MERKLASVVTIDAVNPIEGADRIEVVRVKGWNVVTSKGQFEVGDHAVYFEIDSALPLKDRRFEHFGERGTKTLPSGEQVHVLKTVKLRGQVSQGLVMGLYELELYPDLPLGTDVTERLGVTKHEPELGGGADAVGNFLSQYAEKTDSERVQNIAPEMLTAMGKRQWSATEKVDGSSLTVVKELDGTVRVCSRNLEVGPNSMHFKAAHELGVAGLLAPGETVQGEIVGPGVNGNRLKLDAPRVLVFDLWRDRTVVPRSQWPQWALERAVPVLDIDFPATVDEAVAQADKLMSRVNPKVQAEGIVWHTADGSEVVALGRSTFKVINNSYLVN